MNKKEKKIEDLRKKLKSLDWEKIDTRDKLYMELKQAFEEEGYEFKLPKKKKRKRPEIGKMVMPATLVKYEREALSPYRFIERTMTEAFDVEMQEKTVTFTKQTGPYLEEFTFLKKGIEYKGKRSVPSPRAMKRDLRATMKLLLDKRQNPFDFTMKEKMLALGWTEEELKRASGRDYQRSIIPFIQLATLTYSKSKIMKDGKEKLLHFKHLSPYEEVWLPEKKGDKYGVLIRDSYLKDVDIETGELRPGGFKQLPLINPYKGQFVEETAFDWLETEVRGRSLKIKVETILKEKLKTPDHKYTRKQHCLEHLDRWLSVAREQGYDFAIDTRGGVSPNVANLLLNYSLERLTENKLDLGDCRGWQIEFTSPMQIKFELTDSGRRLADEILHYLYHENEFKIHNPREKTRAYLYLYIRKLGERRVSEIFQLVRASEDVISKPLMLFDMLREADSSRPTPE